MWSGPRRSCGSGPGCAGPTAGRWCARSRSTDRPAAGLGVVDQLRQLAGELGALVGQRHGEGRDEAGQQDEDDEEDEQAWPATGAGRRVTLRCTQPTTRVERHGEEGRRRRATPGSARTSTSRNRTTTVARTMPMLAAMVRTGTCSRVRDGERDMRLAYPHGRTSIRLPRRVVTGLPDGYVPCHAPDPPPCSPDAVMTDARTSVVVITRDRREQVVRTLARLPSCPSGPGGAGRQRLHRRHRRRRPGARTRRSPCSPSRQRGARARTVGVAARRRRRSSPSPTTTPGGLPGDLARAVDRSLRAHPRLALLNARILVGPEERLDPVCAEMAASPLAPRPTCPAPPLLGFVACAALVRTEAFAAGRRLRPGGPLPRRGGAARPRPRRGRLGPGLRRRRRPSTTTPRRSGAAPTSARPRSGAAGCSRR